MSRTRKYRAWDLEDRVFTHFALSDIDARGGIKTPHGWARVSELDEALITEFVGLHDRTGKEMYEGDVVRFDHEDGPVEAVVEHMVSDDESMWISGLCLRFLRNLDEEEIPTDFHPDITIIGNVWQNPELLKP